MVSPAGLLDARRAIRVSTTPWRAFVYRVPQVDVVVTYSLVHERLMLVKEIEDVR